MHHELPARLDVEWYRKEAKRLLRSFRRGEPDAVERVEEALGGRADARFGLTDAQWVIAREHGYRSWADFRRCVETAEAAPPVGRIGRRPVPAYAEEARRLAAAFAARDEAAVRRVRGQEPLARYAAAELPLRDAKLIVAREYGFPTWRDLAAAVERGRAEHEERPEGELGRAYELMLAGDLDGFRALLDARPDLARAQYRGAAATLLEALAQPENHHVDVAFAELLVERGSETREPLNLAACFNHVELVRLLLAAGADTGPSEIWGITPLQAAIYHGSREAGDLLAARGLRPSAFYVAAGAGRADALESWFGPHGTLLPAAVELRPNLADVGWPPAPPPRPLAQDALDEAFALAAFNGRLELLELLLRRGARVDGRVHGLGALHLAVIAGRLDVVRRLVERGADPWVRDAIHDRTAIGWAGGEARRGGAERAAIHDLLLELGPPPTPAAAFEAVWARWGERGEAVLDGGRTYDGTVQVRVHVTKRGDRYLFSDGGGAVEAAGRPPGWLDAARGVAEGRALNVGRNGAVFVPATAQRGLSWLAGLPERVADCSAAVYAALLDLDDS